MRKIYLLPVVFLIFACNSMQKTTTNQSEKSALFTTLYKSDYNGRDETVNLIIQHQEDLNALLKAVESEERPTVDFDTNQVIVLFLGQKNSGGYSISIDRVEEEAGKLNVYKKVQTPQAGENVTMALTNPLVIAVIHSKKEIHFK